MTLNDAYELVAKYGNVTNDISALKRAKPTQSNLTDLFWKMVHGSDLTMSKVNEAIDLICKSKGIEFDRRGE